MKMKKNSFRNTNLRTRRKQGGFALLAITIGLAVIGIVIAAAAAGMSKMEDAKVSAELEELGDLKLNTMKVAASRGGNFTGYSTNLCANYFFDETRRSGSGASTTITNRWKGTITCAPATAISTNDSLAFTYTGVPGGACKKIMASVQADIVSIGGTTVKSVNGAMNEATAITQCDAASNNATIVYTFAR
jgi:type II secretory pathway pseudopilin PulG